MNILVTGGAGYIGTTLLPILLDSKHNITVYDNLMFGGDQLIPFFKNNNFSFVKGDILDNSLLSEHMKDKDVIIHLAAIVGYPACRKDPELAKRVNIDGTKNIISSLTSDQLVIYSSTGSNYGKVDDVCTEDTPLNPLSLYGQTKTMAEHLLLETKQSIVYRFATAFGPSPRLRLDLLINDFTHKCVSQQMHMFIMLL
jgi:nucleoside-diphosphate-sugar epimerase